MMINKKIIIIYILVVFSIFNITSQSKGKTFLAVIALDKYENRLSLTNKVKNADEVKNLLYSNYEIDKVYELYDFNATKNKFLDLFFEIAKELKPDDSLLIYFSGHGYIDELNKEGYWIPYDAGINETAKINWIVITDILNMLYKSNISKLFIISDSVFPDNFTDKIDPALLKEDTLENMKNSPMKARQTISTGLMETTIIPNDFSDNVLNFFKTNKEKYFTTLSLINFLKSKSTLPTLFSANIKDSGYSENSLFYLTAREKPLELVKKEDPRPVEIIKEEKPIIETKPDEKLLEESKKEESIKKERIKPHIESQTKQMNAYNKAGFILLPFAASILTAGVFIFSLDMIVISDNVNKIVEDSENRDYEEYVREYKTHLTFFCTGLGLLATGLTMFAAAIPLAVYKPKSSKISFNIGINKGLTFNFKYNF